MHHWFSFCLFQMFKKKIHFFYENVQKNICNNFVITFNKSVCVNETIFISYVSTNNSVRGFFLLTHKVVNWMKLKCYTIFVMSFFTFCISINFVRGRKNHITTSTQPLFTRKIFIHCCIRYADIITRFLYVYIFIFIFFCVY